MKPGRAYPAMNSKPSRKSPFLLILGALVLFGVASVCRLNLPAGEPGVASGAGTWRVYDLYAFKMARWEPESRTAHAAEAYAIAWPFAASWKEYLKANKATG